MKPFPIERGIPVPGSPAKGRKVIYPFAGMKVGDCFSVFVAIEREKFIRRIRSAARYHGVRIILRDRSRRGVAGFTVWKVGDVR